MVNALELIVVLAVSVAIAYMVSGAETEKRLDDTAKDPVATLMVGKVYKIYKEKKPWRDAKASCEKNGAQLASVHSRLDENRLREVLNSAEIYFAWLGSKNEARGWYWLTGEAVALEGYDWAKYCLGDRFKKDGVSCLGMHGRSNTPGVCAHNKCTDSHGFVCELILPSGNWTVI